MNGFLAMSLIAVRNLRFWSRKETRKLLLDFHHKIQNTIFPIIWVKQASLDWLTNITIIRKRHNRRLAKRLQKLDNFRVKLITLESVGRTSYIVMGLTSIRLALFTCFTLSTVFQAFNIRVTKLNSSGLRHLSMKSATEKFFVLGSGSYTRKLILTNAGSIEDFSLI